MARSLLSLILALVLAALGSSFAFAQSDDDPCASDAVAGISQAEDDEGEEWLDEDEEWLDDEEYVPDDEEDFEDEELFDEEFPEDESEGCDDFLPEDEEEGEAAEESSGADTDTTSSGRDRRGTGGADRFIGDAGVNRFWGRGGDDYLDGAGGRDLLNGGPGSDTILTGKRKAGTSRKRAKKKGAEVNAGKGDDVVRSRNGRVDKVHCGQGKDSVLADRGDRVRKNNCESVRYG